MTSTTVRRNCVLFLFFLFSSLVSHSLNSGLHRIGHAWFFDFGIVRIVVVLGATRISPDKAGTVWGWFILHTTRTRLMCLCLCGSLHWCRHCEVHPHRRRRRWTKTHPFGSSSQLVGGEPRRRVTTMTMTTLLVLILPTTDNRGERTNPSDTRSANTDNKRRRDVATIGTMVVNYTVRVVLVLCCCLLELLLMCCCVVRCFVGRWNAAFDV